LIGSPADDRTVACGIEKMKLPVQPEAGTVRIDLTRHRDAGNLSDPHFLSSRDENSK
jgi:hypothetical protein